MPVQRGVESRQGSVSPYVQKAKPAMPDAMIAMLEAAGPIQNMAARPKENDPDVFRIEIPNSPYDIRIWGDGDWGGPGFCFRQSEQYAMEYMHRATNESCDPPKGYIIHHISESHHTENPPRNGASVGEFDMFFCLEGNKYRLTYPSENGDTKFGFIMPVRLTSPQRLDGLVFHTFPGAP